jgi:hypothetical protein
MTLEDRQLLEITARKLLKLEEDILGRVAGIEAVLHAFFVTQGNTALALARLRIHADLLKMKGTPSPFLNSFLKNIDADLERLERGTQALSDDQP